MKSIKCFIPKILIWREEDVIAHKKKDNPSLEVNLSWKPERLYNFVRAFDFPPYGLPFVKRNGRKFYLSVRPERHGVTRDNVEYISYNENRIFMLEDEAKVMY